MYVWKVAKMGSSDGENSTNNISSGTSSNLTQMLIDKVKSAIGFFLMSEDEMIQAGIDPGKHHVNHPNSDSELQSDSPIARDFRKIS